MSTVKKQGARYNIEVTEKDIAKAKRNDSYIWVVSQAIALAISDATRIETDTQTIRFTKNGDRLVFLTPYAVQGYVIGFDAGDPIQPFSFQLRSPIKHVRHRLTETGAKVNRAQVRARRRVAKKAKHGGLPLDAAEVKREAREAAKAAYAEAVAAGDDTQQTTTTNPGARYVPRVFKRKHRTYGHRLLRINQEPVAESTN